MFNWKQYLQDNRDNGTVSTGVLYTAWQMDDSRLAAFSRDELELMLADMKAQESRDQFFADATDGDAPPELVALHRRGVELDDNAVQRLQVAINNLSDASV